MRKTVTLIVMMAALLSFVSPSAVSARTGETEAAAAPEQDFVKLTGKIGPYAITFFIDPIASGDYVGYYYYNARPQNHFSLSCKRREQINIKGSVQYVLFEKSPAGKHTGTFRGQYEQRVGSFSGVFTNSKGVKYTFELYEE